LAGDLTHARASTESPYGAIVSEWQRGNGRLTLDVRIPPNSSATVFLPTSDPDALRKVGVLPGGVSFLRAEANRAVLLAGTGRYSFQVPLMNITNSN
jgi:alpha-L-rhamnosidase